MSKREKWIVTTDPARPIREISRDLAARGFKVDQVLDEIGSITGTAAAGKGHALKDIEGVVDVAPDSGIDIGPPGSNPTW